MKKGGYHVFPSKIFGLTVPKNFVEQLFCVSENFWYRKILWIRGGGGVSRFSVKNFLSRSAAKFRRGTRLCFRKFRVSKNFMPKRGISRFSIENLLSHSSEKLRRGTLLICVSKNFWYRKNLWIKGGGGRGREYHDFLSKISCLTVPKNFVGEPFSVSLISGIERFYASESYITILCRNFLSRSAKKFRRGILYCFIKFEYRKMLGIREGGIHDFPSKTFCLTVPKIFVGTSSCFTSFGYRKC